MASIPSKSLAYLVHHIILPPRLPQEAEALEDVILAEQALLEFAFVKVRSYQLCVEHVQNKDDGLMPVIIIAWKTIAKMLSSWLTLTSSYYLTKSTLIQLFAKLQPQDVLAVQTKAQNTCLILRKTSERVIIECFEISPRSGPTLECQANLVRWFPGHAVAIPNTIFEDVRFQQELAALLRKLDIEVVDEMQPKTRKAASNVTEIRDTTHPTLVTDMLMAILASLGEPVTVRQIRKRTRDDVLWADCLQPWRRSSLWLCIRVAIQSTLATVLTQTIATGQYKNFMVYFLTGILKQASNMPMDIPTIIMRKVARRIHKLKGDAYPFLQEEALGAMKAVRSVQETSWLRTQRDDAARPTQTDVSSLYHDTALTLRNSGPYLKSVLTDSDRGASPNTLEFKPLCKSWAALSENALPSVQFGQHDGDELIFALADFESWISHNLSNWVVGKAATTPSDRDCITLADLIKDYMRSASRAYEGVSEQFSSMVLNTMELWCALDRLTIRCLPLLEEFSPSIPLDYFNPLLLKIREDMKRLLKLERYLKIRQDQANPHNPSLFSDPSRQSFSNQFYRSSTEHHELRKRIEVQASKDDEKKNDEWIKSDEEYRRLSKEAQDLTCQRFHDRRGIERHDPGRCKKCKLLQQAKSMCIDVFEWPLPQNDAQCEAAVFEIRCPGSFAAYRDVTWSIIHDLGRLADTPGEPKRVGLLTYGPFQSYIERKYSRQRLTMVSTTKSYMQAHYRSPKFPVALADLKVNNGLRYRLCDGDGDGDVWVAQQQLPPSIASKCSTLLAEGPYSNLQFAVNSCQHSQNEVIAKQGECSNSLSIREYIAFGSLRADGERTQWLNIKRELAASNLDWNCEAVGILISQAAWQVGRGETAGGLQSPPDVLRVSHNEFSSSEFCLELLALVCNILDSVESNWKNDSALHLLVIITLRTLSLAPNEEVTSTALSFLRRLRLVLFEWVKDVGLLLGKSRQQSHIKDLQQRLVKTAIICRMTYGTDANHTEQVMRSQYDLDCWVLCSLVIQDNMSGTNSSSPRELRCLVLRDKKLAYALLGTVSRLTIENANGYNGLDLAIRRIWSSFNNGSKKSWMALPAPSDRWLETKTVAAHTNQPQTVLYNILEGDLLVDGRPLSKLPKDYISDSTYQRLFGPQVLRVFASNMPGMSYRSALLIGQYYLHFGIRHHKFIIRAEKDSQVLELVPHFLFTDDLPKIQVDDYTHWLDLETQEIELRPLGQHWLSNPENWRLQYKFGDRSLLCTSSTTLVDIRSQTFGSLARILEPLETPDYLHVTVTDNGRLEVHLPRFDLRFYLNDDHRLECYELRKVVDENQSVGSLIGLQSRLVLCGLRKYSEERDRIMIIPEGEVSISGPRPHVRVTISTKGRKVRILQYSIDEILGRLIGDGTLFSTLMQVYLHAVTSSALSDPLISRTGTEEALSMLQESIAHCSAPVSADVLAILQLISNLTPRRELYPRHLRVMQTVRWHHTLSPLSQHDDFTTLAFEFVRIGNSFGIFYPNTSYIPVLEERSDRELLLRAKKRNSTLWSSNNGGNMLLHAHDGAYEARDCRNSCDRGRRAYEIASLIRAWPPKLEVTRTLWEDLCRYGKVSGFGSEYNLSDLSGLLDIDFAKSWGALHESCLASAQGSYKLLFLFSVIAYGRGVVALTHIRTLLAFTFVPRLRDITTRPAGSAFDLLKGWIPQESTLRSILAQHKRPFQSEALDTFADHQAIRQRQREIAAYDQRVEADLMTIVCSYMSQWPCHTPRIPEANLIELADASRIISAHFLQWDKNRLFKGYVDQVQEVLTDSSDATSSSFTLPSNWLSVEKMLEVAEEILLPTLGELLSVDAPGLPKRPIDLHSQSTLSSAFPVNLKLQAMIGKFSSSPSSNRNKYGKGLQESLDALHMYKEMLTPSAIPYSLSDLHTHYEQSCYYTTSILIQIRNCLQPISQVPAILRLGGLWPRMSSREILSLLSTFSTVHLKRQWEECIIALGEALTLQQRARRMLMSAEQEDVSSFFEESENTGRQGWVAEENRDWLLFEIENNLLIRPKQARVAMEMIQPASASNTLCQLNMGSGKSSVIVPLVAMTLADGKQLARVLVLKSLTKQMHGTLSERLRGLVNRSVYFMPFSRRTKIDAVIISQIHNMQKRCLGEKGILLIQPEHILSFHLLGIERLISSDPIAPGLLQIQQWLEANSRDILDESDEILDVKFQLIYTIGSQRMVDGQPDRWLLMQAIFDLVNNHAADLQKFYPGQIEVKRRSSGSFPVIRVFTSEAATTLKSLLVQDIEAGRLYGINFDRYSSAVKSAILRFIVKPQIDGEDSQILIASITDDKHCYRMLLLIRGLLAHSILLFSISKKRWSVNYGLHPSRCLAAVPYRAKGIPSESAEFGHPDVAIALTCLSYYYSGLSDEQIRQCVERLQQSEDPTLEYESWTRLSTLDSGLRSWNGVNLEDDQQCLGVLFPAIKYSKKLADYFLRTFVFPREAKEFEKKLTTSGWDVPLASSSHPSCITTGFSGTNDNKYLLPLSISQRDLPELLYTNASVLDIVLREENAVYHCVKNQSGGQVTATELITFMVSADSSVRVLLDVGAQVLDLTNQAVVRAWLDLSQDAEAGVYFDEDDNIMVLTRDGKTEHLGSSSFRDRLGCCFVYLDETHCRGVDFKLPRDTRAVVTLGPGLTKDRLVQGCMRLRKLGHGQSIMFLAPPEVHQSILEVVKKGCGTKLDVSDVIEWSLEQSCLNIEQCQPLHVMQGLSHYERLDKMEKFRIQFTSSSIAQQTIDIFGEEEEQSLSDLYAPSPMKTVRASMFGRFKGSANENVRHLLKVWEELDPFTAHSASAQEEHERELAQEVEEEVQIERPGQATPKPPRVDKRLLLFIESGTQSDLLQFSSVFNAIIRTSSVKYFLHNKSISLYVSNDFAAVVKKQNHDKGNQDQYLRPVNYVLASKHPSTSGQTAALLIISQYEVDKTLPEIRHSKNVALHIYEPRLTKSLKAADSPAAYGTSGRNWRSIDADVRLQLHIFAGQLYVNTKAEYERLRRAYIAPAPEPLLGTLTFLKEWMSIRRRGLDYQRTHIGKICSARVLEEEDFLG